MQPIYKKSRVYYIMCIVYMQKLLMCASVVANWNMPLLRIRGETKIRSEVWAELHRFLVAGRIRFARFVSCCIAILAQ